jgi:hypothetical protein
LLDAGLRVINVIDIDYPAHHTPRDTFDRYRARACRSWGMSQWS